MTLVNYIYAQMSFEQCIKLINGARINMPIRTPMDTKNKSFFTMEFYRIGPDVYGSYEGVETFVEKVSATQQRCAS